MVCDAFNNAFKLGHCRLWVQDPLVVYVTSNQENIVFKLSLVLFIICNFVVDRCSSLLALEATNNFTLTICHPHVRGVS